MSGKPKRKPGRKSQLRRRPKRSEPPPPHPRLPSDAGGLAAVRGAAAVARCLCHPGAIAPEPSAGGARLPAQSCQGGGAEGDAHPEGSRPCGPTAKKRGQGPGCRYRLKHEGPYRTAREAGGHRYCPAAANLASSTAVWAACARVAQAISGGEDQEGCCPLSRGTPRRPRTTRCPPGRTSVHRRRLIYLPPIGAPGESRPGTFSSLIQALPMKGVARPSETSRASEQSGLLPSGGRENDSSRDPLPHPRGSRAAPPPSGSAAPASRHTAPCRCGAFPSGIIECPATGRADQRQHPPPAAAGVRPARRRRDRRSRAAGGSAHSQPALRQRGARGLQDGFEFCVIHRRDHWRRHHTRWDAGGRQLARSACPAAAPGRQRAVPSPAPTADRGW